MNFLDWCLVVLTLAYALSGYWQGFITGAFATAGLLLGGLAGIWLAPAAARRRGPVPLGLAGRAVRRTRDGLARPGDPPVRRQPHPRAHHLAADPGRRRGRRRGAQRGRRARGRVDARRRDQRLADPRHQPAGARLEGPDRGQPGDAGPGPAGAALLRRGRRLELLPALPRAVRARADRQRRSPPSRGSCATPTSATRGPASSRSAAPTAAAAASRAPASSTRPTG